MRQLTRPMLAGLAGCLVIGMTSALPAAAAAPVVDAGAAGAAAASGRISVKWDWSMPTFMTDTKTFVTTDDKSDPDWFQGGSYVPGPDGIPDKPMKPLSRYKNAGNSMYGKLPANKKFAVELNASNTSGSGRLTCRWVIRTGGTPVRAQGNCAQPLTVQLPEGKHPLELSVTDKSGHSKTVVSHVTVKNVLMAVMGDSYGSGEGFPPFTQPTADGSGRQIDWDYASCNRSRWSGFVRAAQQVESADDRSNVTLVDVACAGGEVDKGYIRNIQSISPPVTTETPTGGILYPKRRLKANGVQLAGYEEPQVDQVRTMTRGAKVDSVLLSIGGNDAGLSDVGIACALEDLAAPNCYNEVPFYWDTKPNAKPLYEVVDQNLVDLKKRYQRMAPCFGATGTCRTTKVKGGQPASKATPSKALRLVRDKNLVHIMYPDLTSTTGTVTVAAASPGPTDIEPCTNLPLPQSPMNQIDNTWAYEGLYVGEAETPYTIPDTWSPPLPLPDPDVLIPRGDGLANLIRNNAKRYGWTPELGVLTQSRGHGLCAPTAWTYGLTQAQLLTNPANPAGALHPNDLGQAAYADVAGARAQKLTGVPVRRSATSVINGLG